MFSATCANPDCGEAFDYRRGRLFRFHRTHMNEGASAGKLGPVHFWLCDHCSDAYTLEYTHGNAVLTRVEIGGWLDAQRHMVNSV